MKLDGKSYFVRGKIDRVDKFGDYIAIIDYKTKSSVKYSIKEIYYGERLQLLIYLNAYMSNFDIRPFALLYMPLPYSYAKEEANSAFKYSGLVMDLDEAIQHFDSGFEQVSIHMVAVLTSQIQKSALCLQFQNHFVLPLAQVSKAHI